MLLAYLWTTLAINIGGLGLDVYITWASSQGTLVDDAPRKHVPSSLGWRLLLGCADVTVGVLGVLVSTTFPSSCNVQYRDKTIERAVFGTAVVTLAISAILFGSLGLLWLLGLKEKEVSHLTVHEKLHYNTRKWSRSFATCACCCQGILGGAGGADNTFEVVASVLAGAFESISFAQLTGSDVLAGLSLVRAVQKDEERQALRAMALEASSSKMLREAMRLMQRGGTDSAGLQARLAAAEESDRAATAAADRAAGHVGSDGGGTGAGKRKGTPASATIAAADADALALSTAVAAGRAPFSPSSSSRSAVLQQALQGAYAAPVLPPLRKEQLPRNIIQRIAFLSQRAAMKRRALAALASGTVPLDYSDSLQMRIFAEARHYSAYALGAYGWMMYAYSHVWTCACRLPLLSCKYHCQDLCRDNCFPDGGEDPANLYSRTHYSSMHSLQKKRGTGGLVQGDVCGCNEVALRSILESALELDARSAAFGGAVVGGGLANGAGGAAGAVSAGSGFVADLRGRDVRLTMATEGAGGGAAGGLHPVSGAAESSSSDRGESDRQLLAVGVAGAPLTDTSEIMHQTSTTATSNHAGTAATTAAAVSAAVDTTLPASDRLGARVAQSEAALAGAREGTSPTSAAAATASAAAALAGTHTAAAAPGTLAAALPAAPVLPSAAPAAAAPLPSLGPSRTHILTTSHTNALCTVPWYVAVDGQRRSLVVSARGTLSLEDAVTDAMALPYRIERDLQALQLSHSGIEEALLRESLVHKGIWQAAVGVRNQLLAGGLLELAKRPRNALPFRPGFADQGGSAAGIPAGASSPADDAAPSLGEGGQQLTAQETAALRMAADAQAAVERLPSPPSAMNERTPTQPLLLPTASRSSYGSSNSAAAGASGSGNGVVEGTDATRIPVAAGSAKERAGAVGVAAAAAAAAGTLTSSFSLSSSGSMCGLAPEEGSLQLVIVGHSLGAGVAALLALMLKPYFPGLQCYAFSPPGALVSRRLARAMESFVTSVFVGKDVICRLSIPSISSLLNEVLDVTARCKVSKPKLLGSATAAICISAAPSLACCADPLVRGEQEEDAMPEASRVKLMVEAAAADAEAEGTAAAEEDAARATAVVEAGESGCFGGGRGGSSERAAVAATGTSAGTSSIAGGTAGATATGTLSLSSSRTAGGKKEKLWAYGIHQSFSSHALLHPEGYQPPASSELGRALATLKESKQLYEEQMKQEAAAAGRMLREAGAGGAAAEASLFAAAVPATPGSDVTSSQSSISSAASAVAAAAAASPASAMLDEMKAAAAPQTPRLSVLVDEGEQQRMAERQMLARSQAGDATAGDAAAAGTGIGVDGGLSACSDDWFASMFLRQSPHPASLPAPAGGSFAAAGAGAGTGTGNGDSTASSASLHPLLPSPLSVGMAGGSTAAVAQADPVKAQQMANIYRHSSAMSVKALGGKVARVAPAAAAAAGTGAAAVALERGEEEQLGGPTPAAAATSDYALTGRGGSMEAPASAAAHRFSAATTAAAGGATGAAGEGTVQGVQGVPMSPSEAPGGLYDISAALQLRAALQQPMFLPGRVLHMVKIDTAAVDPCSACCHAVWDRWLPRLLCSCGCGCGGGGGGGAASGSSRRRGVPASALDESEWGGIPAVSAAGVSEQEEDAAADAGYGGARILGPQWSLGDFFAALFCFCFRKVQKIYEPRWARRRDLLRIAVSADMVADHMPDKVMGVLQRTYAQAAASAAALGASEAVGVMGSSPAAPVATVGAGR